MEADHLGGFNFLVYINLENTKQTNKTLLSHFPVCLELRMNYTPLTWYEQEHLRYKTHFEALPRAPFSLHLFELKVLSQRYCLSVIQAGVRVHKTHNSLFTSSYSSFSNSI